MDSRRDRLDLTAILLMLACCALWGLNQVVVKSTLPHLPPLLQAGLRSLIAAALVFAYASWRGIPLLTRDDTRWPGFWAGALFAAEFVVLYIGLQYTTASRLIVFLYLAPFVVAIGMPFISAAERLTKLQAAGLVGAFLALAYAFQEGFGSTADRQWLGDLLSIAAGILWGLTTLVLRATTLSTLPAERALFYQLAVSAPILLAGSLVTGEPLPSPGVFAIGSMLFQSVLVAFASFLVWFWLLRHYPATRVSAFTFLTPVFGLVFGAVLLGEPVSARLIVALAGVAVGIWLVNRR
jgi:drug/metabolite transporter (DMT)-like permease